MTDGAFATDGTFIALPSVDVEPFKRLWQKKVFDLLLRKNKIDPKVVTQMLGWQHSAFSVHPR